MVQPRRFYHGFYGRKYDSGSQIVVEPFCTTVVFVGSGNRACPRPGVPPPKVLLPGDLKGMGTRSTSLL